MGFDGKTLIHPGQVDIANDVWAPSDDEVDHARRVIAAFEEAWPTGAGVVTVDGRMIENLHVANAQRVLAIADAIAAWLTPAVHVEQQRGVNRRTIGLAGPARLRRLDGRRTHRSRRHHGTAPGCLQAFGSWPYAHHAVDGSANIELSIVRRFAEAPPDNVVGSRRRSAPTVGLEGDSAAHHAARASSPRRGAPAP